MWGKLLHLNNFLYTKIVIYAKIEISRNMGDKFIIHDFSKIEKSKEKYNQIYIKLNYSTFL